MPAGELARFRAVVFLNTTGNVLNPARESAFESYIRAAVVMPVCTLPLNRA